ncbi:MAG: aldo/keto reductase [Abitibacteriaceae bacterium]|nr:aldo/keto reductase [Abditibacteriaceae bacterium]MBV9866144.1 aldo/keto reductase [Abditibacteriaceae bacterium]
MVKKDNSQEVNMADRHEPEVAPKDATRRQFLQYAGVAGAALAMSDTILPTAAEAVPAVAMPLLMPLAMSNTGPGEIPRKPLGRTGVEVSVIGLGGSTLGNAASYEEAEQIVHEAIDAGVTFMDNAWEYNEGRSEDWMGRALQGRRDKVFLMTKVCTHGRDRNVAMQMLEDSLRRLKTDHLDLWQVHEVIYYNDPELHFAPNGVIEALEQAKQQGKVRFVGFTGHKHPQIHMKMLQLADQHNYHFDTVQMPLNAFDATYRSFEQTILPEALRRGMGALGMKSLGGGGQPLMQGAINVQDALRYAMSLPVATTISGIDSLSVLRQNLAIARGFKPLSVQEMQAIRTRSAPMAADGHLELYKSTKHYDAAEGRKQHGFPAQEELPV